jgi:large subunit ribosomal protein L2
MGIRKYKPTSAGRRNASVSDFAELTPGASSGEVAVASEAQEGRAEQSG